MGFELDRFIGFSKSFALALQLLVLLLHWELGLLQLDLTALAPMRALGIFQRAALLFQLLHWNTRNSRPEPAGSSAWRWFQQQRM